jgi:hypothetical protein
VPVDASAEWETASSHSSLRSWRLPSRLAMNDTIIRHRYSDPASEPSPLKVRPGPGPCLPCLPA